MVEHKTPAAAKGKAKAKPGAKRADQTSAPGAFRLKELLDRLSAEGAGKKKDLKPAAEAVLHALGAALDRGEVLNLPGLGRARVAKTAEKDGIQIMTVKLKRTAGKLRDAQVKEPLAPADDAS